MTQPPANQDILLIVHYKHWTKIGFLDIKIVDRSTFIFYFEEDEVFNSVLHKVTGSFANGLVENLDEIQLPRILSTATYLNFVCLLVVDRWWVVGRRPVFFVYAPFPLLFICLVGFSPQLPPSATSDFVGVVFSVLVGQTRDGILTQLFEYLTHLGRIGPGQIGLKTGRELFFLL